MNLLWVSRHCMTDRQISSLKKAFGDIEIIQYDKTVENIETLVNTYRDIDIYAVVFPTNMLAELYRVVKGKSRIITPVAERIETGKYIINPTTGDREKEYAFELKYWLEYTKIDIETRIIE